MKRCLWLQSRGVERREITGVMEVDGIGCSEQDGIRWAGWSRTGKNRWDRIDRAG